MKKWLVVLAVLAAGSVWGKTTTGIQPFGGGNRFAVTTVDSPVGTVIQHLTDGRATKNNFQQLRSDSKVYATTSAAETIFAYVTGIDSATSKRFQEQLIVKTGVNDTTSKTYKYIESFWIDQEATAVVELKPTTGLALSLSSVSVGNIHNSPALRIFGDSDNPAITGMSASSSTGTGAWMVEFRVYATLADARDMTDGYYVLWQASGANGTTVDQFVPPAPIYLHPNSVLAAWGSASTGAVRISSTVTGVYKGD